jgi:putative ABC transport system substrate-binding protein
VELTSISSRVATDEIERAIAAFARQPNGGLIMTGSTTAASRRDALVALITRQKLPAIYPYRYYAASGGLFSYGPDTVDQYRRAAGYVDRILKGEKPADLPVQESTKYELVINLKTAKATAVTLSRRRSDRIEMLFAAVRWSLLALSEHSNRASQCPLWG